MDIQLAAKDTNREITLESLNKIFEQNNNPETYLYHGNCHICGCSVNIEITKTSGGYGLLGGILCEPDPENIV